MRKSEFRPRHQKQAILVFFVLNLFLKFLLGYQNSLSKLVHLSIIIVSGLELFYFIFFSLTFTIYGYLKDTGN